MASTSSKATCCNFLQSFIMAMSPNISATVGGYESRRLATDINIPFSFSWLNFRLRLDTAAGFADAAARKHRGRRSQRRSGEIKPKMLQVHGNERRSKGTGRVHGRAANGAGEHRFEPNDRAHSDS